MFDFRTLYPYNERKSNIIGGARIWHPFRRSPLLHSPRKELNGSWASGGTKRSTQPSPGGGLHKSADVWAEQYSTFSQNCLRLRLFQCCWSFRMFLATS